MNRTKREARTANTGFASGGVTCKLGALCFYSSSVQVDSFVLRNPPLLQAAKRWWKCQKNPGRKEKIIKKFAECYLIK
jgi:hypothetical protein